MNRISKEFLALRKSAAHYLRIRKNPEEYVNEWMLEKKGKDYVDWYNKERPRLIQFKDIHKGEDCFIIGNGPSLNKMDLELLNDYYIFGLNKIYLIFNRFKLNIDYLVAINLLIIEQSVTTYEKLQYPIFLNNEYKGKLINNNIYKIFTKYGFDFSTNLLNHIKEGSTVTYAAMQLAFFMGFKNIFLIGVDHNFKQSGKANSTQQMTDDDENHFDPNYFKGNQWQLADLKGSEIAYHNAEYIINLNGRRIFDATVDGKLNIFEKIEFTEALKKAKKKSNK